MSVAPSLPSSTAPSVVGSTSGQPHPSLKVNKWLFSPKCINWVQNIISKENTAAALASIGVDKVVSHIDAVAAQKLDAEMGEDSPDEGSDGGPSDWDLEKDERVSLLSNKEDEEATSGKVAVDQTMDNKATQAPKPDKSTKDNLDKASDEKAFVPGNGNKEGKKCDSWSNSGSRDGPICLNLTLLAMGQKQKSQLDHVSVQVVQ